MFDSSLTIALAVVGAALLAVALGLAVSNRAWKTDGAVNDRRAARTTLWALALMFAGAAIWLVLAWTTESVPPLSSGVYTASVALFVLIQIPMLPRLVQRARQRDE
ncbi:MULTISPECIES: hypothetical protein [unclassified Rathayibacter]|uniref:hypothetical protein n=1 Tax=unclassified Rathayibacter TaxID=2609250 RepID=UPI000CE74131|nr:MULTISPECIES: hypothetical protein [unclassified Rathayibacter]PPF14289.1 hypothetical protein C5B92_15135 [Rathayibacter sp. AY1A4]PPG79920.1 hypothetical protein C5C52_11445 [Rathayibacter sp. AY1E5]PPH31668.1 hypothetical protein C5C94_08035 [Rathayibacter sp. AY1C3]PPH65473.1 hypothetical protein C5D25_04170 [Rathayibacter sp. AY1D7]PPI29366.1 hypothetical protein C5D66_11440 [Rathayibacter sp. AY1B4]